MLPPPFSFVHQDLEAQWEESPCGWAAGAKVHPPPLPPA